MKTIKQVSGVVALALVLAMAADQAAKAGPSGQRTWVTYEIQFSFTHRSTGQTWNQGFTYTRYRNCQGQLVGAIGEAAVHAFLRDMRATGWIETWRSGDRVIGQGTW